MVPSQDAVQSQDALRVLRGFVGFVSGYTSDQSIAGQDNGVSNPPGQFSTIGPQGVVVEGQPQLRMPATTSVAGYAVPTPLLLIGLGVLAVIAIKKLA